MSRVAKSQRRFIVISTAIAAVVGLVALIWALGVISLARDEAQSSLNAQEAEIRAPSRNPGHNERKHAIVSTVSPRVKMEIKKAMELAAIYPSSLKCHLDQAKVLCQRVASRSVLARIKAGQSIYQRVIRRGLTQHLTKARIPIFDASELVCVDAGSAQFDCDRVTDVAPTIETGATVMVSYRPYHVTFDRGHAVVHNQPIPTIPLHRR
jgi:hypothetical protein